MKSKIVNWLKSHRVLRALLPSVVLVLLVCVAAIPSYATLAYLNVQGGYSVTTTIPVKYLDGTTHPSMPKGTLIISSQTNQVINTATLTMFGKTVTMSGLVGSGVKPYIALYGSDGADTYLSISGRITSNGIAGGKIVGYIKSDGEKGLAYGSDGSAASSTVAAYGGSTYSALLTAGTVDQSSVYVEFHNPANTFKVSSLSTLSSGLTSGLSFWHKFQTGQVCGPQIELRFTAPTCVDPEGIGHVDITVHPLEGVTGDSIWKQLVVTSASTPVTYFGNDPVNGDGFYKIGTGGPLTGTLDKINAESAMLAHGANASNWRLNRVRIELWDDMDDGGRTCYIDNVQIGKYTYTLEPTQFSSGFSATKNY